MTGADLMIYDSTYTDDEYPRYKQLGPFHLAGGRAPGRPGRASSAWWCSTTTRATTTPSWTMSPSEAEKARPGTIVAREGMVVTAVSVPLRQPGLAAPGPGMACRPSSACARRGFFLPYRYAESTARAGPAPALSRRLEALFAAEHAGFEARLEELAASTAPSWPRIGRGSARPGAALDPGLVPAGWTAPWPTPWCANRGRPKRVVEVGSGHSTRFVARAVADGGLETRITAIDPAPRAAIGRPAGRPGSRPACRMPVWRPFRSFRRRRHPDDRLQPPA